MTVQTETSRSGPYAGSGTTGPFTVSFRFLDNTHLQVIRTSSAGIDTTLVLTTDYSVSGAGGSSGTVTLVTALAVGERLTVIRNVPFTQLADYVDNDAFPAESHENALDLLTMQTQQNREVLDRSLTLPATVSGVSTELPSPSSQKVIAWNAAGTALENVDANTLASIVAYGTAVGDLFSGTGAQTAFTLTQNPASINNLDVSIGGVAQRPGIDYIWTSGTTLTFTTAPVAGTNNILVRYMQALSMGSGSASDIQYLPAGTGAVATTVQSELRNLQDWYVNVKDAPFYAKADGSDDSAAFAAARTVSNALGKKVHAPAGTYKLNTVLTSTENLIIEGDGDGTVLDFTGTVTGGSYAMEAIGTLTAIGGLSGTQTVGSYTVLFAAAPSLSVGEVFCIYNPTDSSWSGFRTNYRAGEWCEVESISGNTVTLKNPLYDTYAAASVSIYKLTGPIVKISNLRVKGTTVFGLINASLCINPLIENVSGEHANDSVISFDRCFKPTVNNPRIKNVGDGGDDYGIVVSNSQHSRINGGDVYSRRHAITHGGSAAICGVPVRDSRINGVLLKNDTASGVQAADFHGNTEDSSYINCTIYGGANLQGKDNKYTGCKITAFSNGCVGYYAEVKGGRLGFENCEFVTYVDPQPFTRGIIDIGGNTVPVSNLTTLDCTFFVNDCKLYARNMSALTSFVLFKNNGATVKTNFEIDGVTADVNSLAQVLYTANLTGTPLADFVVVDNLRNFPVGTQLHNANGSSYLSFPHRMQRQGGQYSFTTTATTSTIAPVQTYKYKYPREPQSFVSIKPSSGAAAGTVGGQNPFLFSYQTSTTAIRPMVATTANMTAGLNFDLCWATEICEC